MAKGLPDWSKDLRSYQGSVYEANNTKLVSPGDKETITSVIGKGVLLGGLLKTIGLSDPVNSDQIVIQVDGNEISLLDFQDLYNYSVIPPHNNFIYLTNYDEVKVRAAVSIATGISFDEHFHLKYQRSAVYANDALVFGDISYTDIIG